MDDKNIIITAITTIVGSVLTFIATMVKSKHDYQAKLKEDTKSTESIYVSGMEHVITEYKAQVESFRSEVESLRRENLEIRNQIRKLKDERKEITEKLNQERTYFERELELRDELIDELREENEDLKTELLGLKEDK